MAYPVTLAAKIPWHATFNQECIDQAGIFFDILTLTNLQKILANKNFIATAINGADIAKNFGAEVVSFRDNYIGAPVGTPVPSVPVPPAAIVVPANVVVGIDAFTKSIIAQLNVHPAMTDAIRTAMGIMPAPRVLGTVKIISGSPLANSQVLLKLKLAGYSAAAVYMKRNNVTTRVGVSTQANYTDLTGPLTPGQSESREYWIRGILNNVEQGAISATVLVATTP